MQGEVYGGERGLQGRELGTGEGAVGDYTVDKGFYADFGVSTACWRVEMELEERSRE